MNYNAMLQSTREALEELTAGTNPYRRYKRNTALHRFLIATQRKLGIIGDELSLASMERTLQLAEEELTVLAGYQDEQSTDEVEVVPPARYVAATSLVPLHKEDKPGEWARLQAWLYNPWRKPPSERWKPPQISNQPISQNVAKSTATGPDRAPLNSDGRTRGGS